MEGNISNESKENNRIEIHLENNNIKLNESPKKKSEDKNQEEEGKNEEEKQKEENKEVKKEEKKNKEIKDGDKKNEDKKDEEKKEEEKKEVEDEKYDLNKDYNFLSILQFVNLFHKVLGLSPISTTELEFSLLHTDIDLLCCNILSKLLLKKEQHRPTKQNKDKEKDKDNITTENGSNSNEKNTNNNIHNNNQKDKENNNTFNQDNLIQLNETLLKKLNYFYKVYVRYLRKLYNITESSKSLEMIKNDVEIYNHNKYENDYYAFTKQNLSNKFFDDCDIKTELIVKLFRDLNGEHPLRPISNYHELEILMSNKDVEMTNNNYNNNNSETENNGDNNNINLKTFESLKTKQKVILLMFFCNYCMSFSGRQPLYLKEIMNNREESFVNNKKILPFFNDNNNFNNYIFPLNKDCRIYKEKIDDTEINKSITESFDIKVKNYEELEKLLEQEKDQLIVKKLKEKLIEFKTNDEEEQKKINANAKKEEMYQKANKLREMNQNCTSEFEKFNNNLLLMNLSNHMMTRRQLNQIAQLSQVSTRNKCNQLLMREKPKELTEEEKHKLKVQRENLEREKRMQKRNQIIERMQREEEYKLTHPEEAKFLNNKKKREKKKSKKRYDWSDEESEYDENDYEEELMENYNNSDNEKKTKSKKRNYTNTNSIVLSDDEGDKIYTNKSKRNKNEDTDENYEENNNSSENEIVNEGYLIYRYSSNQIELDGNWYVVNDPALKERVSYLFSGSQLTKSVPLIIENNETNALICSANLIECLQLNILFKSCLEFLSGDYSGYFMYYSKTIEDRFKLELEIQDSLVKVFGNGTNSLGNFNLVGYMNFYRNKDVIKEKNNIQDQVIKLAEFKINKIYTKFNPTENEKVIKVIIIEGKRTIVMAMIINK